MKNDILQILEHSNLRKTTVRKDVLRLFFEAGSKALSSKQIEEHLHDIDRITLYRTLKTFEQNGVIHQAVDGTGTSKYALCQDDCSLMHQHQDEHAHFHCLKCDKTICLSGSVKASVATPKGYKVRRAHLILEGKCADCN